MASYLNLRVALTLADGASLVGHIRAIDAAAGSLAVEPAGGGASVTVPRARIAAIELAPEPAAAPAAQAQAPPPQPQPAKKKKAKKAAASAGASSSPAPAGKGKKAAAASTAAPALQGSAALVSDEYADDFDFDAGLRSFDKRKVWDEIRAADTTSPAARLHAHNRAVPGSSALTAGEESDADAPPRRARTAAEGQRKMRHTDLVLSPSPPPVEERFAAAQLADTPPPQASTAPAAAESDGGETLALLCALSGMDLARIPSPSPTPLFALSIYVSSAARTAALRTDAAQGRLVFHFSGTPAKLRFLGPDRGKSDAALLDKLPKQYSGEMGCNAERAALLVGRLREAVEKAGRE